MQLVATEDQELLAKTAADFAAQHSPASRVRRLRDTNDPVGFSRELWQRMAELGWVGILLPEDYGGAGLGLADLAVVLEALGRNLAPEPFLSSVLLGGEALRLGGSELMRKQWLRELAAGGRLLTLAWQEPHARYDRHSVATRAEAAEGGWQLTGDKIQVPDAAVADGILVSARTYGPERDPDGITLFLVSKAAPGLAVTAQQRIDGRGAALVHLDHVWVGPQDVVGELNRAGDLLEAVLDRACAGLCAEMLGAMSEAFERTLAYLKARVQFGRPIGSFQALKHRAARLFIEIELARSAVMAATRAADAGSEEFPKLVSLAKARCSDAFLQVANEAIQMHGGIGVTDEHEIGFYLKRARAAEMTFGDAAWHRDRWARLSDY